MHKHYNNNLPSSFETMFTPLMDRNRKKSYKLEKVVNKYTDNFPSPTTPRLWNKVDINTKEIKSLNIFKDTIKTSFLDKYKEFVCSESNCLSCKYKC